MCFCVSGYAIFGCMTVLLTHAGIMCTRKRGRTLRERVLELLVLCERVFELLVSAPQPNSRSFCCSSRGGTIWRQTFRASSRTTRSMSSMSLEAIRCRTRI